MHAWDEGVAFYAGSLEGTAHGGSSAGKMVYRLAEKRCANFGTCGAAGDATRGTSQVNSELFKAGGLFATGRDLLQQGQCAGAAARRPDRQPDDGAARAGRAPLRVQGTRARARTLTLTLPLNP